MDKPNNLLQRKQSVINEFNIVNFLFPILALGINYFSLFSSKNLLGDKGDARLSIAIYEHWYRFLKGNESLTSTSFFFPAKDTLGLTDSFFGPGMLHSLLRFLGFSTVSAWSYTNIMLIFLGIVGISRMGSRFIKNKLALFGFVLTASVSYPFVTQLGHIQTVGYLMVFWFLDLIYLIKKGSVKQKNRSGFFILIGIPILALSAWYPFALLVLLAVLAYIIDLIFREIPIRSSIQNDLKQLKLKMLGNLHKKSASLYISIGISAVLSLLWLRIYIPAFHALQNHSWGEINFYSPRLGDLLNASNRASGFKKVFYEKMHLSNQPTYERALGLTLTLFIFVIVCTYMLVRKSQAISQSNRIVASKILLLSLLPMFILVQDEFGHSAWFPFWKILPGVESIRAPFRVSIFCSWLLIALFYYLFQDMRKIKLIFITILMVVDTTRVIPTDWNRDQYLPSITDKISSQIQDARCQSFYLRPKSAGDNTLFQIDSEIIATSIRIPTVNGYSGNFARGWRTGLNPANDAELTKWLKFNTSQRNINLCVFNFDGKLINRIAT